jgi:hypothetical protein
MSCLGNGATGTSDTGPALGYILNYLWFILLFMLVSGINMNTSTCFDVTIMELIFGIKTCQNLPIYLRLGVWSSRINLTRYLKSTCEKLPFLEGLSLHKAQSPCFFSLTLSSHLVLLSSKNKNETGFYGHMGICPTGFLTSD